MSEYAAPSEASEPRVRPTTVTLAGVFGYLQLALSVCSAVIGIVIASAIMGALSGVLRSSEIPADQVSVVESAIPIISVLVFGVILIPTVWAIVLGIMTPFFMKGSNGARITAWVFAGLGICCGAISIPSSGSSTITTTGTDAEVSEAIQRAVEQLDIPAWLTPASVVLVILTLLLHIAIVVLLAVPPSNAFFRKRPQQPEFVTPPPAP